MNDLVTFEYRDISYIDLPSKLIERITSYQAATDTHFAIVMIFLPRLEELLMRLGSEDASQYVKEFLRRALNSLPKGSQVIRNNNDVFTICMKTDSLLACEKHVRILESNSAHPVLLKKTIVPLKQVVSALFVDDTSALSPAELSDHSFGINFEARKSNRTIVSNLSDIKPIIDSRKEAFDIRELVISAIERKSFNVVYQPIFELPSNSIIGFESLARLQVESRDISPAIFIPSLRSLGLTGELDLLILELTLDQVPKFIKEAPGTSLIFSVNVSADLFMSEDRTKRYVDMISSRLRSNSSFRLQIEIVEDTFTEGTSRVHSFINQIRAMGHLVVIDDFGMGNSTLSRLIDLKVDGLKLDKFFADQIESDLVIGVNLLSTLITAFTDSGYTITAEGVESAKQLRWFSQHGVTKIQGFYFSRPLALDDARKILRRKAPIPPVIEAKQERSTKKKREWIARIFDSF